MINKKLGPDIQWISHFESRIRQYTRCADYRSGLELAREAYRTWPKIFEVRYQYAKLLGDWADELPPKPRKKHKEGAARILRSLTFALTGRSASSRFGVCINYYYQCNNFFGMVRYGRRISRAGDRHGYFALGVGASLIAKKNFDAKKTNTALRWARVSTAAWKKYKLSQEKYYFAHYCAALSLAIANDHIGSRKCLVAAARLSRKPLSYWEFTDVIDILENQKDKS